MERWRVSISNRDSNTNHNIKLSSILPAIWLVSNRRETLNISWNNCIDEYTCTSPVRYTLPDICSNGHSCTRFAGSIFYQWLDSCSCLNNKIDLDTTFKTRFEVLLKSQENPLTLREARLNTLYPTLSVGVRSRRPVSRIFYNSRVLFVSRSETLVLPRSGKALRLTASRKIKRVRQSVALV